MELQELKKKERLVAFLLCENCFWTASAIGRRGHELASCPACMQEMLTSIPIAPDESYSYGFSKNGSLEMCFSAKVAP
jgi:hypothetical protein